MPRELQSSFLLAISQELKNQGTVALRNWLFSHNEINRVEREIHNRSGHVLINRGMGFVWKELNNKSHDSQKLILSRLYTQGLC